MSVIVNRHNRTLRVQTGSRGVSDIANLHNKTQSSAEGAATMPTIPRPIYCNQAVPTQIQQFCSEDEGLLAKTRALRSTCGEAISHQAIHKYVAAMVSMIWDANKYIDDMEPWILRKTDEDRMATVLYVLMEVLRVSAILYQPLIPTSANEILDQLGIPKDERTFDHLETCSVELGTPISKPKGVFPRLEFDEEH